MQTPLALLVFSTSLLASSALLAGNFEVVAGSATASTQGNQTVIENSSHAILQWDNFSIAVKEHVHFSQPSSRSSVLNRVTGNHLSELYGTLTSNGQVYLINPQGILIGPNALVQTAGFFASTADLLNEDFLNGRNLFSSRGSEGKIVNQGVIQCPEGNIFLIAKEVSNEGLCEGRFVGIGAGTEVWIQPKGTQKIFIRLDPSESREISNTGTIRALAIELISSSPYEKAIRTSGKIEALCMKEEGGRILIATDLGGVKIDGNIEAASGHIQVNGKEIFLTENALVNASGKSGGRIGIHTGESGNIYAEPGAILSADGSLLDGGKIQLAAHHTTDFQGHLSVQGGRNGGSIELGAGKTLIPNAIPNCLGITGDLGTFVVVQGEGVTIRHSSKLDPFTDAWVNQNLAKTNLSLRADEITLKGDVAISWPSKASLKLTGETRVLIEDDQMSGALFCNTSTGSLEIEGKGSTQDPNSGVFSYGATFCFADGNLTFSGNGNGFEGCTFLNSTIATTAITPDSGTIAINGIGGIYFHNTQISTLNGAATLNGDLHAESPRFYALGSGALHLNGAPASTRTLPVLPIDMQVKETLTIENFTYPPSQLSIFNPIKEPQINHNFPLLADAMDLIEMAGEIRTIRTVLPVSTFSPNKAKISIKESAQSPPTTQLNLQR